MDPRLDGIDVSSYNKVDTFQRVPGELAVIRATQGGWFTDGDYMWNVARARMSKRYVGHYMILENTVDTRRGQLQTIDVQADKFVQVVGQPQPGDFAVVDWESPGKDVTPPPVHEAIQMCQALEARGWSGRVMWYTFYSLADGTWPLFEGRPLWLSTLGNPYLLGYRWCEEVGAALWQYDQGDVEGCLSSPIDMNMILNFDIMDSICGWDQEPPVTEEDELVYFQMISNIGNVYVFGPNGSVNLGGMGNVHSKLHESKACPVAAFDVPDEELAEFSRRWREGMRG